MNHLHSIINYMKNHEQTAIGLVMLCISTLTVFATADNVILHFAEKALHNESVRYSEAVNELNDARLSAKNSCELLKAIKAQQKLEVKDEFCGLVF